MNNAHRMGDQPPLNVPVEQLSATIEKLRTNLRHWREECGKLSAQAKSARDWRARAEKAEARVAALEAANQDLQDEMVMLGRRLE